LDNEKKNQLSEYEKQVITMMRELDYGKLTVTIKNGTPVHLEVQKSIMLSK